MPANQGMIDKRQVVFMHIIDMILTYIIESRYSSKIIFKYALNQLFKLLNVTMIYSSND